jgi:drug/metabolite transporter (DMT)-like permease
MTSEDIGEPAISSRQALSRRYLISQTTLAYLALVAGILGLSFSALFVRWSGVPGTVISFYRMGLAAVFMLPFALRPTLPFFSGRLKWKWLLFPLLGGLFTALDHATWSTSIGLTRIANATLLNNIAPLWVALVALFVFKERLGKSFWPGLALMLVGATAVFGSDLLAEPRLGSGDLIALSSSLFYAGYFLTTQRARRHWDTLPYVWLVAVAAAAVLLVMNLAGGQSLSGFPPQTYLSFIGVALASQIIGYFSVGYALGHLPAAVVAPTMIAQPVLTAVLAMPLAREFLPPLQWLGTLLVLAGIYLVNRSSVKSNPIPIEIESE